MAKPEPTHGPDIDIRAILLRAEARALKNLIRAEARALKNLTEHRPRTAMARYEEYLALCEEAYATACAVRRHWEACELRASNENRSTNAHKFVTGDTRKLVGSIAERDAIPANDRFSGLTVVLPKGEQYVLVGGLTNDDWCFPSPKFPTKGPEES